MRRRLILSLCRRLRRRGRYRRRRRIVAVFIIVSGRFHTSGGRRRLFIQAVGLQVLSQGRRVGVGLVAAARGAVERLVRGVDVHVLLPIAGVGKATIAALHLALERFLAWTI
jgi:hypothetical protein